LNDNSYLSDEKRLVDEVAQLLERGADVNTTIHGIELWEDDDGQVQENVVISTPLKIVLDSYFELKKSEESCTNLEELIYFLITQGAQVTANCVRTVIYNKDHRLLEDMLKIYDTSDPVYVFSEEIVEVVKGFGFQTGLYDMETCETKWL
jgi:hypothetical protein